MLWLHMNNNRNDTKPYIKESLIHIYPLVIFLYACVLLFGVAGNIGLLIAIVRRRLYRSPTFFLVANLAVSDIFKTGLVLPLTVISMLLQNWIFGSFICYTLPMLHYFPIHASMLTYVTIAVDRYRLIVYPIKSRPPAELCVIAVWVVAIAAVLPFAAYIIYFDLEDKLGAQFHGLSICWTNIEQHIEQYIRAMFVVMYCLPLLVVASLFIKVSTELNSVDISPTTYSSSTHMETGPQNNEPRVTWSSKREADGEDVADVRPSSIEDSDGEDCEDEMDMSKENRSQKYLTAMVVLFAACWLPINILNILTQFVYENNDNASDYDITYVILTFIGFMSTCINPVIYCFWRMSDNAKDRFSRFFKLRTTYRNNSINLD